jgi:hypothetical protein
VLLPNSITPLAINMITAVGTFCMKVRISSNAGKCCLTHVVIFCNICSVWKSLLTFCATISTRCVFRASFGGSLARSEDWMMNSNSGDWTKRPEPADQPSSVVESRDLVGGNMEHFYDTVRYSDRFDRSCGCNESYPCGGKLLVRRVHVFLSRARVSRLDLSRD